MMESASDLRQAISTFLSTFHEVRRLVDFIEELPLRYEKNLLSYDVLTASKLTYANIENLYHRLTHSSLTEDINNGFTFDMPDKDKISNRLKHLKYSLKREGIFQIEDIDDAYGVEIPTSRLLSVVMDNAQAKDYADTVWGIYREWNLIVDCLGRVVEEIEDEFLNPQPNTVRDINRTIKSDILNRDNIIKAVLKASVDKGIMRYENNNFVWIKSSPLIPFFCERVFNVFSNTEDNESKYSMFNGLIFYRGKQLTNIDISQLRKNWYKTPERKGKDFRPKGYLEIEDFIEEMKEGYVEYID